MGKRRPGSTPDKTMEICRDTRLRSVGPHLGINGVCVCVRFQKTSKAGNHPDDQTNTPLAHTLAPSWSFLWMLLDGSEDWREGNVRSLYKNTSSRNEHRRFFRRK